MSIKSLELIRAQLPEDQFKKIIKYKELILKYQKVVQLVSAQAVNQLDQLHLLDCMLAIKDIPFKTGQRVYDLGSGNGLPGIVLAIQRGDLDIQLVERDTRKADFLERVIQDLDLRGCQVLKVDIQLIQNIPEEAAFISRGLGSVDIHLDMLNSLSIQRGFLLKGFGWKDEIETEKVKKCSTWNISLLSEYNIPGFDRTRVVIQMVRN